MVPIGKVLWAAQATEMKCKRPLRLEGCRLGIITLQAFEKGKAANTPGGWECKHRAVFGEGDSRTQRCQSRPRGHSGRKLNSGQPDSLAGWKRSPGWGCLCRRARVTFPPWPVLSEQHLAPHAVFPPPWFLGRHRQFGRSAENNKSEWIQEQEERTRMKE